MNPFPRYPVFVLALISLLAPLYADDYSIAVDVNSDRGALNRFWQRSVGSCHIGMVNGSHYRDSDTSIALNHRKAYLLAAKELGFKGIRAHGILMDDVGIYHEDSQGNAQYSWENYDELMDFIVRDCGMHPIMELSFMPTDLAADPGANYAFWYGGNVSIPKDYRKWQSLINKIVQHSMDRYGKNEVDQWHWEVYNEPNLSYPGGWEEYCKLYDFAVEGAVAANPDIKIGGSAMDASGTYGYFYKFLDHCRDGINHANGGTGTRITFFSHHVYPDNFGAVGDARFYRERHNFFTDETARYYPNLGLEQMITETGTSYYVFGRNDGFFESHDSGQSGSFVAQTVQSLLYNSIPPPSAWSYWVISDLWEEGFQAPGDKLSYFGIMGATLRKDNIFKPVYHVFKMLTMLGDRLITVSGGSTRGDFKGANAIATKSSDGNQIQILVYNQDYYTGQSHPDDTQADTVTLAVNNLPSTWNRAQVHVFAVDKYHSNSYSTWVKAGSPEYPTDDTWNAMKRDQNLVALKEPIISSLSNHSFQDTFSAHRTGVYLFLLTNPDAAPAKRCDLAITDIQWTPRTPTPGVPVVFSAVVKNQGSVGSPANTHHGVAFYVNGVKKSWSANRNTSIPPGASAVLTASDGVAGAAWSALAGSFKISAEIDDVKIIPEEREDNNIFNKAMESGVSVGLPTGWHNADLGAVAAAGAAGDRSGVFSLTGSGKDIWDTRDEFHYAFQRGGGAVDVSARVQTQENTSSWAKAGVMVRESETETSKFADVVLTPGNGVSFQWRTINGGPCNSVSAPAMGPLFVKLTRRGNEFRGQYSSDGTNWTPLGSPVSIDMNYDITAGLAVTSTNDGQLGLATFTDVNASFSRKEGDPHGLTARYYKGIDRDFSRNYFKSERLVANVDFDWGAGRADPLLSNDLFSIVWKGFVTPTTTQRYTFHTLTDDGVQLWVNNQLLVDKWMDQGPTEHTGSIDLIAGNTYPIEMHFYEKGLGAVAKLMWSGPSLAKEIVPANCLTPGRPDLIVTDVILTPPNPVAGDEVSFAATIKNVGLNPSPSGSVHAVAFYVDGRKFAWSTAQKESVLPGALAYVMADGGVNGTRWTAEGGNHQIMAMVDDNDIIPETEEFNNRFEKSVTCAPPSPAGHGLYARYYNNSDFTDLRMTRLDPKVKFNWIHLSPDLSMGSDSFSVRWSGSVTPRFTETYTFHTETDDGARLWIDGQLIIDRWANQGVTEHTGTIALQAGRAYSIRMDYFDDGLGAVANLYWSSPSQSKEIVPQNCLFPNGHEAEQGTLGGGATVTKYFVGQMHNAGAWNQIENVDGREGGTRTLNIRYATNETNCLKSLFVNGVFLRHVSFPVTGGWETFGLKAESVVLAPGQNNVIRMENATGDGGGVNIDSYIVE